MWLTPRKWLLAYNGDEQEGGTCTELSGDGVRGGEREGSGWPCIPAWMTAWRQALKMDKEERLRGWNLEKMMALLPDMRCVT